MQRFFVLSIALAIAAIAGCKKDNYQEPTSILQGQVVYQDQPIGLRSNGVQLELWQPGFDLSTKIPIYIAQDGTFSAAVFDGHYKLVLLRGNGPWVNNSDTIDVAVNGTTEIAVPVTPYFIIRDAGLSQSGSTLTANFRIEQVNNSLPLESVSVYLGSTTIVDQVNSAASASKAAAEIPDITQPITLTVSIPPSLSAKGYFYARVGVKTSGVAELLYTMPQRIDVK